jgi:hypothetical protein
MSNAAEAAGTPVSAGILPTAQQAIERGEQMREEIVAILKKYDVHSFIGVSCSLIENEEIHLMPFGIGCAEHQGRTISLMLTNLPDDVLEGYASETLKTALGVSTAKFRGLNETSTPFREGHDCRDPEDRTIAKPTAGHK